MILVTLVNAQSHALVCAISTVAKTLKDSWRQNQV